LKVIKDYEKCELTDVNFVESDYRNVPLGKFIDEILGDNKRRKASYADSGTISDKLGFSEKARKHTEKWEDLSRETKDICGKIYQFIKNNN
jgi:hypothetical protein